MTLITATAALSAADTNPNLQLVFRTSSGHVVALYAITVGGALHWRRSSDGGATWSADATLSNGGTAALTTLATVGSLRWHADVLYVASRASSSTLSFLAVPYSDGSGLGTGTPYVDWMQSPGSFYDMDWNGTDLAVAAYDSGGTNDFVFQRFTSAMVPLDAGFRVSKWAGPLLSNVAVRRGPAGITYVTHLQQGAGGALGHGSPFVIPIFNSTPPSPAAFEDSAFAYLNTAVFDVEVEADGTLLFVVNENGALSAIKRVSTNVYARTILPSGALSGAVARITLVPSGDAYVCYQSDANQANGELLVLARISAGWGNPQRLVGGDSSGYHLPVQNAQAAGSAIDVLYLGGTGSSGPLNIVGMGAAGPPQAPTLLAPLGSESSLTPLFSWQYNQTTPSDPQRAIQIQVVRDSDSVLLWDSGTVTQSTYTLAYGGSALAYGSANAWRARALDSVSNSGAGTWGPWSGYAHFTPLRGAAVVITIITPQPSGTPLTVSPGTLVTPHEKTTFTWTQADGHAAASFVQKLYTADGLTLLGQVGTGTGGGAASGSTIESFDTYWPSLVNGTTYLLVVEGTDAVSGVVSPSAPFTLHTAWTPPPPPAGFLVTPDGWGGWVTITWSSGTITIYREQFTPSGASLGVELVAANVSGGTLIDFPAPDRRYIYSATDTSGGVTSSPVTQEVLLPLQACKYGLWLNDMDHPQDLKAVLGALDQWTITAQTLEEETQEVVTLGASKPTSSSGLTKSWSMKANDWFVEDYYTGTGDGEAQYGEDTMRALETMAGNHLPLLFRDPRGNVRIVKIYAYVDQMEEGPHFRAQFEIHEVNDSRPFPTVLL